MISLAGSPRDLADIVQDQNENGLIAAGLSGEVLEEQMLPVRQEVEKIKSLVEGDNGVYLTIPAEYWFSLNQLKTADAAKGTFYTNAFSSGKCGLSGFSG